MASASDRLNASEQHASGASLLAVNDLTKRFRGADGREVTALAGVSLTVSQGEFVALVGPSASGKTTLLSILAGLESPTSGSVALGGDPEAKRLGRVGYMPQRDLLLPWR